ncbi:MAG: GAF domain-containing protein [Myxococcales bacterium]|nr:MAG: GAF domain-containing protein [Myxococcales bacterium]
MRPSFDEILRPDEASAEGPQLIAWLEQVTAPITDARDLSSLAAALTAQVQVLVEAEYIAFYLLDPGSERLILFAQSGFTPDEAAEAERTAYDRHPGHVVRTHEPLHIPDVEADESHRSSAQGRRHAIRSRLFLPIDGEGQCVGTLGVASARPHQFSPLVRASLAFLCRVTGVVYRNLWRMEALGTQLAQIQRQHGQLIELSAPIVEVRPGVLVLPLIGSFDEERAAELTERLLRAVVDRRARAVVLDLTGLSVDSPGALTHLDGVIRALGLIGARALLSGISPTVAMAALTSGVSLPPDATSGSLHQALARLG